jgi:hypothetical protein
MLKTAFCHNRNGETCFEIMRKVFHTYHFERHSAHIHIHELLLEISGLPILDDGQLNTRTRHESNAIRAMRINDDIKN